MYNHLFTSHSDKNHWSLCACINFSLQCAHVTWRILFPEKDETLEQMNTNFRRADGVPRLPVGSVAQVCRLVLSDTIHFLMTQPFW